MIAQAHAERCENKNNPNLSTLSKTFKDVGENIHFTTIESNDIDLFDFKSFALKIVGILLIGLSERKTVNCK